MAELEAILEPSGYQVVAQEGTTRIYIYDTDGNKVNWFDPKDEEWDQYADMLGLKLPDIQKCHHSQCGDPVKEGSIWCLACEDDDENENPVISKKED